MELPNIGGTDGKTMEKRQASHRLDTGPRKQKPDPKGIQNYFPTFYFVTVCGMLAGPNDCKCVHVSCAAGALVP